MSLAFSLCVAKADGGVLLFWWCLALDLLGRGWVGGISRVIVGVVGTSHRCGRSLVMFMFLVLQEGLLDGDPLELRLAFGLFMLDRLVLGEMLEVLWVGVGLVGLSLGGGMVLF